MTMADWLGSFGVAILLAAFLWNLSGRLSRASPVYQALNGIGAGLACVAAALIPFIPFVVLEGVWSVVAFAALVRTVRQMSSTRPSVGREA
ncbi:MAG: hypothetical protein OEM62_10975 [Acidobacteriota bacterium]|nr:hypothetical protein [Acidobacteriota bacterium]